MARDLIGFCLAEIQGFPVGCKGGGGFQIILSCQAGIYDQGVVLHIHDDQVGGQVEDFDGALVARPETLADGVDGAGEPAAAGMPVAVGDIA